MYDQIVDNVSNASFWEKKYQSGDTHWDLDGPTPVISNWITRFQTGKKICVLGAGNGYDAVEITKHGHHVYAVDFSETAISNLKEYAEKQNAHVNTVLSDMFLLPKKFDNFFDIVIEYTCYCAIHPSRREEYRDTVARILKKGGVLVALFFPVNKPLSEGGPPFGIDLSQTISLFKNKFNIRSKMIPELSIGPRAGKEILIEYQKI